MSTLSHDSAHGLESPSESPALASGCTAGRLAADDATARRNAYDDETAAALRLWVTLSRAYAAVQVHAAADVARHGLSLPEFGALEALYHKGPMLVGDLQRGILMSSGGMTFLLDRLAERQLVERRGCPKDRRAIWVGLTTTGVRFMDEVFPAHAARIQAAVAGVAPDRRTPLIAALHDLGRTAAEAACATGLDPSATGAGTARATRRGPRRGTSAPTRG